MKRLFLLSILLLIPSRIFALGSAYGFCEQGNKRVQVQGMNSTTLVQQSYPQCTITVFKAGTITLATIFSDNALTPTPLGNPFTANTNGTWEFFAADGAYDIVKSAGTPSPGITPGITTFGVTVFDPNGINGPALNCAQFPGATGGDKIAACVLALPSTGGILNLGGIQGTQAIATNIGTALSHVTYQFGASTFAISALSTFAGNDIHIRCSGTTFTFPGGQPIGIQMFKLTGTYASIEGCTFDGNKTGVASQPDTGGSWNSGPPRIYYTPVDIEGGTDIHVVGNDFKNVSTSAVNFNNVGRIYIDNNTFVDSYMDPIFTNLGSGQTSQYIHIDHNTLKNITDPSCPSISTACYGNGMIVDALDIELTNNIIDGTDRSCAKPTDSASMKRMVVTGNVCRHIGQSNVAIAFPAFSIQNGGDTDVIFANNVISDIGGGGIDTNGIIGLHHNRVTITGNSIFNTGTFGSATGNNQCIFLIYTDSAIVSDNNLDTCSGAGIRIFDSANVTVDNNHIHNVVLSVGVGGSGVDLAGAAGSNGVRICNNSIDTIAAQGVFIEEADTNITVCNNTISFTTGAGYTDVVSTGRVDIFGNTVYMPTASGFVVSNSQLIRNNSVITAGGACYVLKNPQWLNNAGSGCAGGFLTLTGNFISLDNSFYDPVNQNLVIGRNCSVTSPTLTLQVKDCNPSGTTIFSVQAGAAQGGNPLIDLFDIAGNETLTFYSQPGPAGPVLVFNRTDSASIPIQFRANTTVESIIGLSMAANDIATNSLPGDFVVRSQSATTGLLIASSGSNGCHILTGAGNPNSTVVGHVCDIYLNKSGGSSTTAYLKVSGDSTNTGWEKITTAP